MKLRKRQPERQTAVELRQALEARGATIRQAVRALLRDFGYGNVTPKACEEVQRKLEEAGIAYEPSLVDAKPSQMITLSLTAQSEPQPEPEAQPVEEAAEEAVAEPIMEENVVAEPMEAEATEAEHAAASDSRLQTLIASQQEA